MDRFDLKNRNQRESKIKQREGEGEGEADADIHIMTKEESDFERNPSGKKNMHCYPSLLVHISKCYKTCEIDLERGGNRGG